jgi:hypothetical protein
VVEPEVTAVTIFALVAVTTTLLPAVTLDREMRSASAELTSLSDGTGSAIALADEVPAEAGDAPATVSVADDAIAGPAMSIVPTRATAEAIAISGFLNEVIFLDLLILDYFETIQIFFDVFRDRLIFYHIVPLVVNMVFRPIPIGMNLYLKVLILWCM